MATNAKLLGKAMIDAARTAAASEWPAIKPVAEMQLRSLSQAAAEIETLLASNAIDESRARELFAIYRTASHGVLQTTSRSSQVAKVVTDVAVTVIRGALGTALGIGNVTANFRAGKDL
jgi:hypothetical protein